VVTGANRAQRSSFKIKITGVKTFDCKYMWRLEYFKYVSFQTKFIIAIKAKSAYAPSPYRK
jgi:hypothetical protein